MLRSCGAYGRAEQGSATNQMGGPAYHIALRLITLSIPIPLLRCKQQECTPTITRVLLLILWYIMQGKIVRMSKYDPLDLFSMDTERMRQALLALLAEPQNNLRLFSNGRPIDFRHASMQKKTCDNFRFLYWGFRRVGLIAHCHCLACAVEAFRKHLAGASLISIPRAIYI